MKRILKIDPKHGKADPDGNIVWYDCQLLKVEGKGWTDTAAYYDRLPAKAKGLVPAAVWDLSHDTAGICVRFTTDSASMQVRWSLLKDNLAMPHMPATGVSGIDLYGRNEAGGKFRFFGNGRPTGAKNRASFNLTAGSENILYLPLYNGVKSIQIGIPKGKTISIPKPSRRDRRKPIVFYGTSITQGGCASRPGMAATAIVGRELDVRVINLGFSGSGRMEPEMADLLAELDPSIYVLDCLWNMNPGQVNERAEPFVRKLREMHPGTPILLVEKSNFRNALTETGHILRMIHAKLIKAGIKGLYFLPNKGMLGNDFEGTVDGCHPNDLGMMRQAVVFIKSLTKILQSSEA
ncbi:MAG: SGNH/GDSL hydrolase family protein [Kiritimatiellae bacterium]|nr:SGNH/GDSL hydrolase family protein [Kiritimatiellia bacterium]